MKTNKTKNIAVLAMVIFLALIPVSGISGQMPGIFQFPEYSSPEYSDYARVAEYVTMSDGTKLATVRYVPTGGPARSAFPVIFIYTPYHYDVINPVTGKTQPQLMTEAVKFYTSYGYVMVVTDMRGSGASYGSRMNFSPQLAADGKEMVDWIAAQPWSDGKVGMIGVSYYGWSQLATAGRKPAALKCIIPGYMGFDEYTRGSQYPGGIRQNGGMFGPGGPSFFDLNMYLPNSPLVTLAMPATPIYDEDGDGDLADEIPLDLNGNGTFMDDYSFPNNPPRYSDGKQRQNLYYLMTKEHLGNSVLVNKILGFRDDPVYVGSDITFDKIGPNDYPVRIAETGIPILIEEGWFDRFSTAMTQWYATLAKTNHAGLVVGPTIHHWTGVIHSSDPGPYVEYFGEDKAAYVQGFQYMRLRFLDHYLKGIDNGADKQSEKVYIYVMNGEGWRTEKEWPLKRQKMTDFMFDVGNSLTDKKSHKNQGADSYVVDQSLDSRQPVTNANRWGGVFNTVWTRTEKDNKALTYTSDPLDKDTEVTGHPIAHLWVSSTASDGDFYVYLEDVDENGNALDVSEGQLRAGFAKLVPNGDILPAGLNMKILPELPWHGYKKTDYNPNILAGGNIVELTFDLFPTSWVFRKGHKIRVSVTGADWPTFLLHPMLSPTNNPNDPNNTVPTITLHHDKEHPSRIELPVIPKE